jgi:hypothetical protein
MLSTVCGLVVAVALWCRSPAGFVAVAKFETQHCSNVAHLVDIQHLCLFLLSMTLRNRYDAHVCLGMLCAARVAPAIVQVGSLLSTNQGLRSPCIS